MTPRARRRVFLVFAFVFSVSELPAHTPVASRAGAVTAVLPVARLERDSGVVEARPNEAVLWRDWLRTEAGARARIELLDGSLLNIGSQARLQILRHDRASEQTDLELQYGKARAVVRQLAEPGARFEVKTNTAVVGVIGTHFYVEAAVLTVVISFEGRVRARNADASVAGEVVLEPFELAEIEPGKPPRKRRATPEEMRRALEDTLPGEPLRLAPAVARVGACLTAVADEPVVADATGAVARSDSLEVTRHACRAADVTPLRVCVPESAAPGAYEFAAQTADGAERWAALLVEPAAPRQAAQLIYSPELPPAATHYARVVGPDYQPLAGVPVRIRADGQEKVVHTDTKGGLIVQAPARGRLDLEIAGEAATSPTSLSGAAAPAIGASINVVERAAAKPIETEFSQPGGVIEVPGDVAGARLGSLNLPVARTTTRNGRTTSTVAIPRDIPAGPNELELEDAAGQRTRRPVRVYELLSARLDQPALMSGMETGGEFLVCLGAAGAKNPKKVRATILAVGPVRFRGRGAQGRTMTQSVPVSPEGLLRVPFRIRAEKGAPGAGVPFTLTLILEKD